MTYPQQSRFTETQAFAAWAYAVLIAVMVPSLGSLVYAVVKTPSLRWLLPTDTVLMALVFNLLCLRTTVTETEVAVTFGALLPLYRRRIALREIASAEAVTYSPLAEYGGWGIRGWGKDTALNARGNRGVRLTLRDGRRVLIGSQRPDDLAAALSPPSPQ